MAAVLVVVVMLGVGVAVGLLTLEDDGGSPEATPSGSTSPTEGPTESTATPDPESRIIGTGYSYPLLDGWSEVTEDVKGDDPSLVGIDSVSAWGRSVPTGRSNLIVEATSSFGETDPEALRAQWEATVENAVQSEGEPIDAPTIDGAEAIGLEISRKNESGVAIVQTSYLTVRDGSQYGLTYTVTEGDEEAQAVLDELLAGWTWES